jgi:hypothetical protein
MGKTKYHFSPAAMGEIAKKRDQLGRYHEAGLITTEQAIREYLAFCAKLMREARQETTDDRLIGVRCECGREHHMPGTIARFNCECGRKDIPTFKNRINLDANLGSIVLAR